MLHNFSGVDGASILSPLVQGSDGNFYGTSAQGGSSNSGVVFKITPTHNFSVLHNMNGTTDGNGPVAGLIQATDGNFYGVDGAGGSNSNCDAPCGTLFSITPTGNYSVLYNFDGKTGANPTVTPFQHTNGFVYSDTNYGGTGNIKPCTPGACGVFYNVDIGLGPFVSFVGPLSSGKVGKTIQILGQGFIGTTAVSFNGTSAMFTVKSDTYLSAIVPEGAATGFVTVTTPGGVLKSNRQFWIRP